MISADCRGTLLEVSTEYYVLIKWAIVTRTSASQPSKLLTHSVFRTIIHLLYEGISQSFSSSEYASY